MTLAELNSLDRARFLEAIGWVFEHSPWVAEQVYDARPYPTIAALYQAMARQVEAAAPEKQLALLKAHPDLGSRARVSAASAAEQTGAGLDRLTPEQFERLHRLNSAYGARFGFPFLLAVRGSTRDNILQALERRLKASPEQERQEALRQVLRIAEWRLQDAIT